MPQNIELIKRYFNALSKGDFVTAGNFMTDNLIWHQPGKGSLSGTFKSNEDVFAHISDFAKLSRGTFAIDSVEYIADNGDFVAVALHSIASAGSGSISMKGIDLFRIINGNNIPSCFIKCRID